MTNANIDMGFDRVLSPEEKEAKGEYEKYVWKVRFKTRLHWTAKEEDGKRFICFSRTFTFNPIEGKIPSKEFVTMTSEGLLSRIKTILTV